MSRLGENIEVGPEISDPISAQIIRQYTAVSSRLEMMFAEIRLRTSRDSWRKGSGKFEGIGSCKVDDSGASGFISHNAKKDFIQQRNHRNAEITGENNPDSCRYHRVNKGCSLGKLKNPLCIGFVGIHNEMWLRFQIDGRRLSGDIHSILERISSGNVESRLNDDLNPEANEEFTQDACNAVEQMTDYIKKFSIETGEYWYISPPVQDSGLKFNKSKKQYISNPLSLD